MYVRIYVYICYVVCGRRQELCPNHWRILVRPHSIAPKYKCASVGSQSQFAGSLAFNQREIEEEIEVERSDHVHSASHHSIKFFSWQSKFANIHSSLDLVYYTSGNSWSLSIFWCSISTTRSLHDLCACCASKSSIRTYTYFQASFCLLISFTIREHIHSICMLKCDFITHLCYEHIIDIYKYIQSKREKEKDKLLSAKR